MFRRLVTVAPRSVGTLVSPRITPALSGLQTQQPIFRASPAPQRRGYHEKVLDHYNNPRNAGSMKVSEDVGSGLVGAPACGDVMKLQIRVDKDTHTISDVKFKTFGCGSAIASSSYLTELVRGMTLEEAGKIRNTDIAKELCLPPVKLHCSMLAEDAIKSAISDYYTKNPKARSTNLGGTGASMPQVEVEVEKTGGAAASL
ncbi:putative iron-sulfur cofactor synthesis protein (Isu1) [Aspergillus melleus]|uniref:putative iron-sulfur cofactor synthesis protein (Isu1) n=1 Tax=Aspergillus melleus TaxID=138277 RepID=UPI001E8CE215|nr:iron-binding protein [Aspergillus melleus]KAH8428798.1 iron-binding protein [Aspergillus melleus]